MARSRRPQTLLLVVGVALTTLAASQLAAKPADKATGKPGKPAGKRPLPRLADDGPLAFEITDADTGELIPGKLTLIGVGKHHDPALSKSDVGREFDGGVAAYNRVFSLAGTGVLRVPAGTYDITVSRGPEWDLVFVPGVVVDARGAEVRAALHHVVDTTGWLSADFHVHSASSHDSRVPMQDRVFEFVSDGVDMIVSADHNVVSDYAPLITELGAGAYLTSAAGDELTTHDWGHFGAFPLPAALGAEGTGALPVHGKTAEELFAEARAAGPDVLIDVHHPRLGRTIGYFDEGRFDAGADAAGRIGFSFDFDAVEVLNGYQDPDRASVDQVIADWFGLIQHGHLVTATGNSDTHHLTYNLGGYPRNYVLVGDDCPDHVTPAQVARAVKAHHCFLTTGPFVALTVGDAGIGDVAPTPKGSAHVNVEVRAAPWVSVSTVTLYVDGQVAKQWTVPASTAAVRLHEGWDVQVARDAFVVVRVDGDQPMSPVVGDQDRFRVLPFALTNPIFLDVDGNGAYDAPMAHGPHLQKATKAKTKPKKKAKKDQQYEH